MEWEFTPQQVVKAEVDYGFEDFRRDLRQEVEMNAGGDAAQIQATNDLLFDLCYWLATNRELDAFVAQHAAAPPTCEFLREVAPAMAANADMLGAILQRMIMAEVERGAKLEEGVANVHRLVVQTTAKLRH
ncbi:MAG: hypothetical protein HZC24_12795 [Rhodocyclales bacterium]|nr:hypothetical protein [Rhodocyclales bacterium]